MARDARAEHAAAHILGAVFFDIDEIADSDSELPHMLPGAAKFSARMRRLGLGDGTRIVVYDNNGFIASARAWWMLRLFGHPEVAVLDGGLGKWRAEGHPVDDRPVQPVERHFTARQNNLLVRELDQIRANVTSRREQVIDARSEGRFSGPTRSRVRACAAAISPAVATCLTGGSSRRTAPSPRRTSCDGGS